MIDVSNQAQHRTKSADKRRLIVSIHDVAPIHESAIDRLRVLLADAGVASCAMLVVPNFWGCSPLSSKSAFGTRLRGWAEEGVEIFLHGFLHRDDQRHRGLLNRFKAAHMTAGEGEFLGLSAAEARRRIEAGRAIVEDVTGRPITGFVAPAWLYGQGTLAALAEAGIELAEDHCTVWNPVSGRTLVRSPVGTWASRSTVRRWSSLSVAAAIRNLPMPGVVRLAVHPGDVNHSTIAASVDATVRRLVRTRAVGRYRDLLPDPSPSAGSTGPSELAGTSGYSVRRLGISP